MQQSAAAAYGRTTQATVQPRDLEAHLLMKSAAQLQTIHDNWEDLQDSLNDALFYNRRLWGVFLDAVTAEDSPLPKPIAQNVANLGFFVFNHTLKIQLNPERQKLRSLISINKEIAAGLRTAPDGDAPVESAETQAPSAA
ncbi:MAG: flagellar biosynthesis regulator FlaF [Hyphomicrobiales bacterium]|jgi:flagellar protein FlaF